jgi:hypothetical protein
MKAVSLGRPCSKVRSDCSSRHHTCTTSYGVLYLFLFGVLTHFLPKLQERNRRLGSDVISVRGRRFWSSRHSDMAQACVKGSRLSINGALCTVRYVGEVQGTKGQWLGVEWDDPTRGKHSGDHQGVKYFECDVLSPLIHISPLQLFFFQYLYFP